MKLCLDNKYETEKAKTGIEEYDLTYQKYFSERDTNSRDSNWPKSISNLYTSISIDQTYDLLKQQGSISIDKK